MICHPKVANEAVSRNKLQAARQLALTQGNQIVQNSSPKGVISPNLHPIPQFPPTIKLSGHRNEFQTMFLRSQPRSTQRSDGNLRFQQARLEVCDQNVKRQLGRATQKGRDPLVKMMTCAPAGKFWTQKLIKVLMFSMMAHAPLWRILFGGPKTKAHGLVLT